MCGLCSYFTESPPYSSKLISATKNDLHYSCPLSESSHLLPRVLVFILISAMDVDSIGILRASGLRPSDNMSEYNSPSQFRSKHSFTPSKLHVSKMIPVGLCLSQLPFRVFCQCEIKIFFLLFPRLWIRSPLVNYLDTDLP